MNLVNTTDRWRLFEWVSVGRGCFVTPVWHTVIMDGTAIERRVINEIGVVLPNLSVGNATLEQLQVRLQSTFRADNQAGAVRAETLAS